MRKGSFSATVAFFGRSTDAKLDRLRRAVGIKLFSSVIMDTPVLTGRLRGNWTASFGDPKAVVDSKPDKSGQATQTEMTTVVSESEKGSPLFLANSLPYAKRIEYDGWSAKAPEGMVRRNVLRIRSILLERAKQEL